MHPSRPGDSEAVLRAVQRHRTRLPALQSRPSQPEQHSNRPPLSYSYHGNTTRSRREKEREDEEKKIWERLNASAFLPYELHNQFGGQVRHLAVQNYGGRSERPSERQPKLIDQLLMNRNRDYSDKQQTALLHLQHLDEERSKLLAEHKLLRDKRRHVKAPPTPTFSLSGGSVQTVGSDWSTQDTVGRFAQSPADSVHSVHGVDSFIKHANNSLPAQIAKYNRLRDQIQGDYHRRMKPYKGELGPQSYRSWQMDDYHMVRGLVDTLVDKFLDSHFKIYPVGVGMHTAQAVADAEAREWEKRSHAITETKVVQLLMEELVLEVTGDMSQEVGEEFTHLYNYIRNQTDTQFMNSAEMIAMNCDTPRQEDDPAYQLVAKTLFNLQKDRSKYRPNVWKHTQELHMKGPEQVQEEPVDPDVQLLDFHNIAPMDLRMYDPRPADTEDERRVKQTFTAYRQREAQHWQKMTASVKTLPVSSKCQGVKSAALSADQKLLALGTAHGDVMVYNTQTQPWRPLAAIHNQGSGNDQVIDLSWSSDGQHLIAANQTGTLAVWSTQSGKALEKAELKGLELKYDSATKTPQQLAMKLVLDRDSRDFQFHSGALADASVVDASHVPTLGAFCPIPSHTAGQQNCVCLALDSGDVMKCDVGQKLYPDTQPPPTAPADAAEMTTPNSIGQGLLADLLRQHKHCVILLGFVHDTSDIVTVDVKGYISVWTLTREELTSFEWYVPQKKYKLDMSKMMYRPTTSTRPNIIFTDRTQADKRRKTRQDINTERLQVQTRIDELKLSHPWHVEHVQEQNLLTETYKPSEAITDTGTLFHVIIKHYDTQQLSTYFTRVYKPFKLWCTKLLGCCRTPSGCDVIFLLLFPAYPPKGAHMTIVILDLHSMTLRDYRHDVMMSAEQYQRCLQEDIVSCHVSRVFGPTGSAYLFVNCGGVLSAYSLNTGLKVLRTDEPKKNNGDFIGCQVKQKSWTISPYSHLLVAATKGKFYGIAYAIDQKQKKLQNQVTVLEVTDSSTAEDRQHTWNIFTAWAGHPKLPPQDQRLDPLDWTPPEPVPLLDCFKQQIPDASPPTPGDASDP